MRTRERRAVLTAVRRAIHVTLDRGDGGIIAVDHRGNIAIDFSTQGMARGWADANGAWEVRVGREDGRP